MQQVALLAVRHLAKKISINLRTNRFQYFQIAKNPPPQVG